MRKAEYIQQALELRNRGLTCREIARELFPNEPEDKTMERVKKALQRNSGRSHARWQCVEGNKDGTTTFSGIIELMENEQVTPERIMIAHKLDSSEWEVISYKSNFWQSQAKGGKIVILYQSKITVKPRKIAITTEEIEAYFNNLKFSEIRKIKPAHHDPNGDVLEVCIPDLHSGLFSWKAETGEDYDFIVVRERFESCIADILARCEGKRFSKIYFVTLGDLLHVDNMQGTTTKGTPQTVDGRFPRFFSNTMDLILDAVTAFEAIAPVEVIYIVGNHDELVGFTLLKAVEAAFKSDPNVTVDAAPNPRKWRRIGRNLIGWCHGDMPKKHQTSWLHQEAREAYGQTDYAEVHAGHLHSQQTEEANGQIYRSLPTICAASAWENKQAFGRSHRCVMSFLWSPTEAGPREIWCSNIKSAQEEKENAI